MICRTLCIDWPLGHPSFGNEGVNQTGHTHRPFSDAVFRRIPHSESSARPSLLMLEREAITQEPVLGPVVRQGAEGIIGGRPALIVIRV